MAVAAAAGSTLRGISDNEKRWVVFGIVLNKILLDQIRSFVKQEVLREYDNLKSSHGIDTQSTSGRLKKWPTVLKYENINGNDALPKVHGKYNYAAFDCHVTSHADFAKLYVENFMAKFNAFDEHCDASAVLTLLGKVPVFSVAVQSAASDVRQARNSWAHCAFGDWDPAKFRQSFHVMEQLVKALGLPPADQTKLLGDLKDWETKGTLLCMNATVDPDLLRLVQHHVIALSNDVEALAFEVKEDRHRVLKALREIFTKLEKLEKRVTSVECEQEVIKENQSSLSNKVDALHTSLKGIESQQEDFQRRVAHVEDQLSSVILTDNTPGEPNHSRLANTASGQDHNSVFVDIARCEADVTFFAKRHDPDTRQWLFDDFDNWFSDPGDSRAYVLLGDAGVGKSVMAGVLVQRTRKAGHLGAAYFCCHNDGTRNDPRYLLGTVACQLCDCNSQYSNIVGGEGGVRMMLANSKLGVRELFRKLFEEPLVKCSPCQQRKLVIIDALDETEYESREVFLDLIKERFPRLPNWLVFFITSRPEDTVRSRLEKYNRVRICAGNSGQHSFYRQHEEDIRQYLKKRIHFTSVPYSVEDITNKCNGLFLYAFYIQKELGVLEHSGKMDQLNDLFPGDIDDFFRENFQRLCDKVGADLYKKLIGCVVAAPSPLPVSFIPFVLKREKSDLGEQEVIDAVLHFSLHQTSDDSVTFLHKLIPTWLTKNLQERKNQQTSKRKRKDCPHLLIDKKAAGEYLRTILVEILPAVVGNRPPELPTVDMGLQDYVSRAAVRFLCQLGDKESLRTVFSCLTSYHFLEKRIQNRRTEIYDLLEDLKLVASCSAFEDAYVRSTLQEISLAFESNVYVLLECPQLLHSCLLNLSKSVRENVVIPQVSAPSLEWNVRNFTNIECLSGFSVFATASDKKTVAAAKGRSLVFVDASTLKIVGGPFELSHDAIKGINHLEFSPDDKFVFFGRLDKWFSIERGCVEELFLFSKNSAIYQWGFFTPNGRCIVLKRDDSDNFPRTCQGKCCVADVLSLWAVKEINQCQDSEKTCSFSKVSTEIFLSTTILGEQTKRLLEYLRIDPKLYQTHTTFVPNDPNCFYCGRLRKLTASNQEPSLAAVRQHIIELYSHIFQYQVWNFHTGRPLLQEVFDGGIQLGPFTYFCHVARTLTNWCSTTGCSSIGEALTVCNIAVFNAVYTLEKMSREVWLEEMPEHLQTAWQGYVVPELELMGDWKWEWELERRQARERLQQREIESEETFDLFKFDICRNSPTGFHCLFGKDTFVRAISLCVSPEMKWVVRAKGVNDIRLLRTGIEARKFTVVENKKQEHVVTGVERFTFTNDGLYFVYSSLICTLHALSLQTGTVFTSVSGRNLFYFTKEKQVGYLFRSETEEISIFLTNLFCPFLFLPLSPVKTPLIGKTIAATFRSSNTVMFISSDSMTSLLLFTDNGCAILSELPLVCSSEPVLQTCLISSDGRLVAFQEGNKIMLHMFSQSGKGTRILLEKDSAFTVVFTFSADSTLLVFCIQDGRDLPHFRVWDVQREDITASFKSPVLPSIDCCCLSSDKRKLILCGEYEIEVWGYDKYPCRLLARTGVERLYNDVTFSQCAVSGDSELLVCCVANKIIVYNLCVPDVYSSKRILRGHLGRIDFCAFLKLNRYLISYGVDGIVFLWDLYNTKAVGFVRVAQGKENVISMAVSPEEDKVVCFTSCSRVCEIKLCNLECALSSKFLTVQMNCKVNTAQTSQQVAGEITSTSTSRAPFVENDHSSSSESEEDVHDYYVSHDCVDEAD